MSKRTVRILVTGGGTGGHVSPALAVIQELQQMASEPGATFTPVFRYIGSEAGIEAKLVREAGIDFAAVQSGKLRRSRNPLAMLNPANLRDALRIPVGLAQSFGEVQKFRPDVVLATGGYVSVPPVLAAGFLKVPILTHEQTVTVGLANRLTARFATRIALTFEGAASELPVAVRHKAFVTGNPVRPAIFDGERERARERFGFVAADDALPTVYVTGGAQGARVINRAVEEVLPKLLTQCRIIHQCGKQPEGSEQDFDRLTGVVRELSETLRHRYSLMRFVETEAIGDAFALSDVVVSRSGAGTVTEVAILGKPAVFVPLVPTGGDEQTRNAQRSVDAGAAVILKQGECNGTNLQRVLGELLKDREKRVRMGEAARTLARPGAARELAAAVLGLARVEEGHSVS